MVGKGRIENLRPPWKPGESGNPSGRPKSRPISDRYQACAEKRLPEDLRMMLKLKKGATYGDAVALAQFRAAIKGKSDAAREVREAIEGKATQRLEHSGAEGKPMQFVITHLIPGTYSDPRK